MKTKRKLALRISLVLMAFLILTISITAVVASASETVVEVGEIVGINDEFSGYVIQNTVRKDDGGYVGDYQYTVFHDSSKGTIKPGYEGTPVIIYTINHPGIERIGTDSNSTIIRSMLDKGYIVIVLDYLNNSKAVSPAIANSTQAFRTAIRDGKILTSSAFPKGGYHENFLVPSGYNVRLNEVFWEIDKHSTEGTLEKIVENWNSDFRATKGTKLVKWVHTDGTRKSVQNDFEGNAPVWYNSDGSKNEASGQYTYVKFTKAETITDCVDPDGSFIDMNLYINIVYPTSPAKEVPVMSLANSSGYPTTSVTGADLRPHSNDFLYNGYANVVFDYLWEPMARNASWGYYDGSGGITQDHMNYALMMYNDKLVNTAAMRYLRYISLSGGNTYNFDLDAFGVYGNSKGGWFSYLGEKTLQSKLVANTAGMTDAQKKDAITDALAALIPDRYYDGHHGETRYQVGAGSITADGFTVKAGEVQPWLLYNGEEILSGAQLTNACNGSQEEDITAGHSPIFISGNMTDTYNAAYSYSVNIHNLCKNLNIPLLHFEVPIGHTLTSGIDMNYNVDTYDAYFRYVGYYLKDTPISVAYVSPMPNAGEVKVTDKIKIGFAGAATLDEVSKITLTAGATTVQGSWESSYGGTVWTFIPEALSGDTKYTLTIPATFAGDNGKQMGKAYTESFTTEYDNATVAEASGDYYTLTAPALTDGNGFVFRFRVANDAANVAKLYAVSAIGETSGELLGSVNLRGAGSYEIDVSDYIAANSGKAVVLYLTGANAAGTTTVKSDNFDSSTLNGNFSKNNKVEYLTAQSIDGKTALGLYIKTPTAKDVSVYYDNVSSAFSYKQIVSTSAPKASDLGRRYTISFDVYDTVTRVMRISLNSMTKRVDYGTIDYDNVYHNVKTKANAWTHVEFTYEVYEPEYGFPSASGSQSLSVAISPSGNTNKLAYFDNLLVTETVTDINVTSAFVAEKNDGTGAYSAPVSTSPFAVYNGEAKVGEYAGWAAALGAYKSGYTIKLQCDYTLTDADLSDAIGSFATVNLDFGTYTVTCANTKNSLFWAKAANTTATAVNVTGGAIRLGRTALISYESSASAGSGKIFNFNFTNTYVGFAENAWTTEIISDSDTAADVSIGSNISFNGCKLDFDDAAHAKDASLIFTAPVTRSLKINYTLTGGEIELSSQRWITILENAKIVEFKKDSDGNYTTLIMPESITTPVSGSYLVEDGYAAYEKASVTDNMATYKLTKSANSTKYGIITSNYADADAYPLLLFKDGVLISAHQTLASAITASKDLLGDASHADSQAEILLRKNVENTAEPNYGNTAGTLLIDLGGYTITRNKVIINAVVTSSTPMFETNVIFRNGRLETASSVMGVTHCLYTTENVKTFNFTFDRVTFGFASDATNVGSAFWSIWQNSHPTVIDTNLTFKNCTFDLYNNKPNKTGTLFSLNTAQAECDVVVEGGEIIGNGSGITIFGTDRADSVLLKKNSNGEYIKFTSKNGGTPVVDNFLCDDGKYRNFQQTDNGYELKENNLATPYGIIPSSYADEQKYPFIVFKEDGTVLGAYEYFYGVNGSSTSAWGASKEYVKANKFDVDTGKFTVDKYKAYIVMRRDYTFQTVTKDGVQRSEYTDNFAQVRGDITLDLGGFTLTQDAASTQSIFNATSKRWETVTNAAGETVNYTFPSTYNIKNGTIRTSKTSIIKHSASDSSSALKVFTFNFDNVTFGLANGATTSNLLATYGTGNYAAGLKLNLNDCTFDLNTVKPTTAITLISANNTPSKVDTDITLRGTTFLADSFDNITVMATSKPGSVSVKFIPDDNGRLATLKTLSATTPYTGYLVSDDGNMYFVEREDNGTNSVYYLESIATPYGTPSHDTITKNPGYLSAVDYPFFLFQNGSFKRVDEVWGLAISHIKDYAKGSAGASKSAQIVLRRDYTTSKKSPANIAGGTRDDATSSVLYNIGGTMIIDLNGYSIIRGDRPVFDIYGGTDESKAYKTTIIVKNGNLVVSGGQLIGSDHGDTITSATGAKVWDMTFENVAVSYATGATTKTMLLATWTTGTGYSSKFNLTLNNCDFDLTNAPTGVTLINASDARSKGGCIDYTVTFNGGKVIGYIPTFMNSNAGDSISYGKYEGEYIGVVLPASASHPNNTYTAANGASISFGKYEANDSYILYRLGEDIKTAYGNIPFRYQSVQDYPFIIFGENKNCIGADDTFLDITSSYDNDGAFNVAKGYLTSNVWSGTSYGSNPRSAIILLRRDYTMASAETYNNIAQLQGLLTIDLAGFTLTAPEGKPVIPATIKPWTGSGDLAIFPSFITFINGEIVVRNSSVNRFDAWTGDATRPDDYVKDKLLDFNYENVKFTVKGTTDNLLATFAKSGTPNAIAYTRLTLTDCVIDITDANDGIVLFGLGNGLINNDVTVNGGEIIAGDTKFSMYSKADSTTSKIVFTKSEGGNYTALTVSAGADVPTEEFELSSAKAIFVKVSESDGTETYRLRDISLTDVKFTPKMSLTLDRDLVFNIYVPVESLVKFTLDGVNYANLSELEAFKEELTDGDYYRIQLPIAAKNATRAVVLTATVDIGNGKTATATFSFDIVKYALEVLKGDNEAENKVMLDVLSYVRAAYTYFKMNDNDAAIARIDEILGENYDANNAPVIEGSAAAPTEGLASATFILDATPAIRFYLADGADASAYSFYANGVSLATEMGTDGDRVYIDIDVYAYRMCETITYTVNGTEAGSFHIRCYYEWTLGQSDDALTNVVARFWRYTQSARDYRNSVIGG